MLPGGLSTRGSGMEETAPWSGACCPRYGKQNPVCSLHRTQVLRRLPCREDDILRCRGGSREVSWCILRRAGPAASSHAGNGGDEQARPGLFAENGFRTTCRLQVVNFGRSSAGPTAPIRPLHLLRLPSCFVTSSYPLSPPALTVLSRSPQSSHCR